MFFEHDLGKQIERKVSNAIKQTYLNENSIEVADGGKGGEKQKMEAQLLW